MIFNAIFYYKIVYYHKIILILLLKINFNKFYFLHVKILHIQAQSQLEHLGTEYKTKNAKNKDDFFIDKDAVLSSMIAGGALGGAFSVPSVAYQNSLKNQQIAQNQINIAQQNARDILSSAYKSNPTWTNIAINNEQINENIQSTQQLQTSLDVSYQNLKEEFTNQHNFTNTNEPRQLDNDTWINIQVPPSIQPQNAEQSQNTDNILTNQNLQPTEPTPNEQPQNLDNILTNQDLQPTEPTPSEQPQIADNIIPEQTPPKTQTSTNQIEQTPQPLNTKQTNSQIVDNIPTKQPTEQSQITDNITINQEQIPTTKDTQPTKQEPIKQSQNTNNPTTKDTQTKEEPTKPSKPLSYDEVISLISTKPQSGQSLPVIGLESLSADVVKYLHVNNKKIAVWIESDKNILDNFNFKYKNDVKHTIKAQDINHVINRHGHENIKENSISYKDISDYMDVVNNADIISVYKTKQTNLPAIAYGKQVNGHYVVVEEAQRGNNELAFKTMYKSNGKVQDNPAFREDETSGKRVSRRSIHPSVSPRLVSDEIIPKLNTKSQETSHQPSEEKKQLNINEQNNERTNNMPDTSKSEAKTIEKKEPTKKQTNQPTSKEIKQENELTSEPTNEEIKQESKLLKPTFDHQALNNAIIKEAKKQLNVKDLTNEENNQPTNQTSKNHDIIPNKGVKYEKDERSRESLSNGDISKHDVTRHQKTEQGSIEDSGANSQRLHLDDGADDGARLSKQRSSRSDNLQLHSIVDEFLLSQEQVYSNSKSKRIDDNLEAIRLLKLNKSFYSKDELLALSKYSGYGGLSEFFNHKEQYEAKHQILKSYLTDEEYFSLQSSTDSAYYTPHSIIKAQYDIAKSLGFNGSNILEPSVGNGRFIGLNPFKNHTSFTGVEIDLITSSITKLLYPHANIITSGYEHTSMPNQFDLVIGNPPYGSANIYDKNTNQSYSMHNFFVLKALKDVKAGGFVNFVISTSFLDNITPDLANKISSVAKLVGAIRLPSDTFANTQVSSDIVVFQKLHPNIKHIDTSWHKTKQGEFKINNYFIENKHNVLGQMSRKGIYNSLIVTKNPNFENDLKEAISNTFNENIFSTSKNTSNISANLGELIQEKNNLIYYLQDSDGVIQKHYIRINNELKAKQYLELKKQYLDVLSSQIDKNISEKELNKKRKQLLNLYTEYTNKYDALNSKSNEFINNDVFNGLALLSLEKNYTAKTKTSNQSYELADILTTRTAHAIQDIKTNDVKEALAFSLSQKAQVDIDFIAKLTNKSYEQVLNELGDEVFYDSEDGFVTKSVFLSGDVKTKLNKATTDKEINALKKVIPQDIKIQDISLELGQEFIPDEYVELFATSLDIQQASIQNSLAKKQLDGWGGSKVSSYRLKVLNYALSGTPAIVKKQGKTDFTATTLLNSDIEMMKNDFIKFLLQDDEKIKAIEKSYNELNNRFSTYNQKSLDYDIKDLSYFIPRPHQQEATYKAVFENKALLLNHPVGSGKTLTSQMIAMEWKRLKKANKPLIATLKSVVPQYVKEFRVAFPNAKILTPTLKDFSGNNKDKFLRQIQVGNFDVIVISHEQLRYFDNPAQIQKDLLNEELNQISENLKHSNSRNVTNELNKAKKNLIARIEKLNDKPLSGLDFASVGIDGIIVDEAHAYKGLNYSHAMGTIRGMPSVEGSLKAQDLFVKTQYLLRKNKYKNVIFMTGTPIVNTLPELYLMQKYLQYDVLKQQNKLSFNSWAKEYAVVESDIELNSVGGFKEVTRIKQFKNLKALKKTTNEFIHSVSNEEIKASNPDFILPKLKNNMPTMEIIDATKEQLQLNESLITRLDKIKQPNNKDNHLSIFTDARKLSIDVKLLDFNKPSNNSKIHKVVDNIFKKYQEFNDVKGTQLVFSDIGVHSSKDNPYNVYDDVKAKLIEKGIKEEEIDFAQNYTTSHEKVVLSEKINKGELRVVLGSTKTLGTGINAQKKLVAIHHIDIPYTPADLNQRNGRILRQGNELINEVKNFEAEIFYYASKGLLDGLNWQFVENKQKFISAFFTNEQTDEIDIEDMSLQDIAENMKALSSNNPLLLTKVKLQKELKKQNALLLTYEFSNLNAKTNLQKANSKLAYINSTHDKLLIDADELKKYTSIKEFSQGIKIDNFTPSKEHTLGDKISEILISKELVKTPIKIGDITLKVNNDLYNSSEIKIDFIGKYKKTLSLLRKDIKSSGIVTRLYNFSKSYQSDVEENESLQQTLPITIASLEKQILIPFENQAKLNELERQVNDIVAQLNQSAKTQSIPKENKSEDENTDIYSSYTSAKSVGDNYIPPYNAKTYPSRSDIIIDGELIDNADVYNPQTVEDIRGILKNFLGQRIYDFNVRGRKSRLGLYNKSGAFIRVRNYNDVDVLAHEVAHYLDFTYANKHFFSSFKSKNSDFLKSVSYTNNKKVALSEGFAEFVRLYLTRYNDLQSIDNSSDVIDEFNTLLQEDTKLYNTIKLLQQRMHRYYNQGGLAYLSSAANSSISKQAKTPLKSSISKNSAKLRQKTIDKYHSIYKIQKELLDPIAPASNNAYKLFRLINGYQGTYQTALKLGVPYVKPNGDLAINENILPLDKIFSPLSAKQVQLWKNYALARRGAELKKRKLENRLNDEAIKEGLELEKTYPHFKQIFDNYQIFNNAMLDFYVSMKLITSDQKEIFTQLNQDYIPFHRVKTNSSDVVRSSINKSLKGGTSTINDILDNIYGSLEKNIKDAYVARAKSFLYESLKNNGGGAYAAEILKTSKLVKSELKTQAKNIAQTLSDLGLSIQKNTLEIHPGINQTSIEDIENVLLNNPKLLEILQINIPPTSHKMIDSAIINDKRVYFEINDELLQDTLLSITPNKVHGLVKLAHQVKVAHTYNITANPLFYLPNAARDTISASVLSEDGFIPFIDTIRGMISYIAKDKYYKALLVNGSLGSSRASGMGFKDPNYQTYKSLTSLQKAIEFISTYGSDLFENSTRMGEGIKAIKHKKSLLESTYKYRNISTDFSGTGSDESFAALVSSISFARAAINSIDRLYQRARDAKTYQSKMKFFVASGSIMAFSLMVSMLNEDDERYKALSPQAKALGLHLYLDNIFPRAILDALNFPVHVFIPKPHDLGAFLMDMPQMVYEYFSKDEELSDIYKRVKFNLMRSVGIFDIPTIFKGMYEVAKNENYLGIKIESEANKYQPKHKRVNKNTPFLYKALGNSYLSPVQINHLANSLLGLNGRMLDDMLNYISYDESKSGEKPFQKNLLTYLLSSTIKQEYSSNTKYTQSFYTLANEVVQTHNEAKGLIKNQDIKGIAQFKKDKNRMFLNNLYSKINQVKRALSNQRKLKEQIYNAKTLSKQQKEKRLNQLMLNEQRYLERFLKNINSSKESYGL